MTVIFYVFVPVYVCHQCGHRVCDCVRINVCVCNEDALTG